MSRTPKLRTSWALAATFWNVDRDAVHRSPHCCTGANTNMTQMSWLFCRATSSSWTPTGAGGNPQRNGLTRGLTGMDNRDAPSAHTFPVNV